MYDQKITGYPSIDKPWLKYYGKTAISNPLPEESLYDYMLNCNKNHMNYTALNYFGKKITYSTFASSIERCAKALIAYGVKKGDIVSVCMLTTPEVLILLYAVNRIGAVCNFSVLNTTIQEMHQQISQVESTLIFTNDLVLEKVIQVAHETNIKKIIEISVYESMPRVISIIKGKRNRKSKEINIIDWQQFLDEGQYVELDAIKVLSSDLAVIEYTGGTTGESKGVMLSNRAINAVAFHYKNSSDLFSFQSGEKFLCMIPPFLSVGLVTTLVMPLCMGFELILIPDPSPEMTAKNVMKYKPNHVCGGALHIENLINDKKVKKANLSFLSTVAYGGDKSDLDWEKKVTNFLFMHGVKYRLINGYGLTETASSVCTIMHRTDFMIPFVQNNIMICDIECEKELTYEMEGEIYISGPSLMSGYYQKPDETKKVLFERNGIFWIRTGDLGKVTKEGALYITGRIKRILWVLSEDNVIYRVYPMKIEAIIRMCQGVKHCAVVGVANEKRGHLLVAFVVLQSKEIDKQFLTQEIMMQCSSELEGSSQIQELRFVNSLPSTRAGKVDYRLLEKIAAGEIENSK